MNGYRYELIERYCTRCKRRHEIAVRLFGNGDVFSDELPLMRCCYACRFAQLSAQERVLLQNLYQILWRRATNKPLPPELA